MFSEAMTMVVLKMWRQAWTLTVEMDHRSTEMVSINPRAPTAQVKEGRERAMEG